MSQGKKDSVLAASHACISYNAAMRSWFVLVDGSVHCIQTANSIDILIFLNACCSQKKYCRINVTSLLGMLDFEDGDLTRWFLLDELLRGGVTIPLFPSEEDAMDSQMSYNK